VDRADDTVLAKALTWAAEGGGGTSGSGTNGTTGTSGTIGTSGTSPGA
jgi:hypothetical protein